MDFCLAIQVTMGKTSGKAGADAAPVPFVYHSLLLSEMKQGQQNWPMARPDPIHFDPVNRRPDLIFLKFCADWEIRNS